MTYGQINRGQFGGDRFTIVSNLAVRDSRLSYKARGLLAVLASHRDGWGITAEQLAKGSPDGVSAVTSGLKELERHGYMRRLRERRADGTLGGSRWVITDDPDTLTDQVSALESSLDVGTTLHERQNPRSEPTCDFPSLDEPSLDEPTQDDRRTKNTNHKNTSDLSREGEEEDARAHASADPSPSEDGGPAADAAAPEVPAVPAAVSGQRSVAPTMASLDFVEELVRTQVPQGVKVPGEDIQELAALLDDAQPVVEATGGLDWETYLGYLRQGWWKGKKRLWNTSWVGALKDRLRSQHIRSRAVAWAAETRSEPTGGVKGAHTTPTDPFSGTVSASEVCLVHKTLYTIDAHGQPRCAQCEADTAPTPTVPEQSDAVEELDLDDADLPEPDPALTASILQEWQQTGS